MSAHGMSEAGGLREVLGAHVSQRVRNLPGCSCGETYPGLPGDLPTPREWHLDHLAAVVAAREAAAATKARAEAGEQIAQAIVDHVEHMRGYTIPASGEQWLSGYDHALHLFARDAGFIADRATRSES